MGQSLTTERRPVLVFHSDWEVMQVGISLSGDEYLAAAKW